MEVIGLIGVQHNFWSVGGNFLAPIYTGGALKAQVKIETAKPEIFQCILLICCVFRVYFRQVYLYKIIREKISIYVRRF